MVRDAHRSGASTLAVSPGVVITPLARDTARHLKIDFVRVEADRRTRLKPATRSVAIGSDHGGWSYKEQLIPFVRESGWHVIDVGTNSEKICDYPDYALKVANAVAVGKADLGIMIDGAGIGSAMACNKVSGVRAACAYNEFTAWNARAHNDANVLTLGSRTLGIEVCRAIVRVFLTESFEGGRHLGRVRKIDAIGAGHGATRSDP
ncbi:MAG: ribose 5-phosphate isomerase B [Rhodothermales bacterium]|nr:ribose 5-phosphate isomerase B [Rhodothermales bacterium]